MDNNNGCAKKKEKTKHKALYRPDAENDRILKMSATWVGFCSLT